MDELGDLVVIIGKNSAGKSNILEGLNATFGAFTIVGGNTPGIDEYIFHNRDTRHPADFVVRLRLEEGEVREIFPGEWIAVLQWFDETRAKNPEVRDADPLNSLKADWGDSRTIAFRRQLTSPQGNWNTVALAWGPLLLVKDNGVVQPEEVKRHILERIGELAEKDTVGAVQRPEVPDFASQALTQSLSALERIIKGRFFLIPAIRDVKGTAILRTPVLDPSTEQKLWQLDQSTGAEEDQKSSSIEQAFRRVTSQRLDYAQGRAFVRKPGRIPLVYEGGGIQSAVNFIHTLVADLGQYGIVAVEEPENHAHPDLQRRLLAELKSLSKSHQIIIATHSPVFVDRSDLSSTWIAKSDEGQTRLESLQEAGQALSELGARPSDILFANRILFVEGRTEEIVVPAFAFRLGIDVSDCAIIPIRGKTNADRHLELWTRIARNALPLFLILDADAKAELAKLEKEGLVKRDQYHIWREGTIEDYYPADILETALHLLNERFTLGLDLKDLIVQIKTRKLNPGKIDLGKKTSLLGVSWKVALGEAVAEIVRQRDVELPDEIRAAIERGAKAT